MIHICYQVTCNIYVAVDCLLSMHLAFVISHISVQKIFLWILVGND